jgi:hypothetical protein
MVQARILPPVFEMIRPFGVPLFPPPHFPSTLAPPLKRYPSVAQPSRFFLQDGIVLRKSLPNLFNAIISFLPSPLDTPLLTLFLPRVLPAVFNHVTRTPFGPIVWIDDSCLVPPKLFGPATSAYYFLLSASTTHLQ